MTKIMGFLNKMNTRSIIAILCCLVNFYFINYILIHYGDHMEILTLIIGLIGGTMIGSVFGFYFGGTNSKGTDDTVTH